MWALGGGLALGGLDQAAAQQASSATSSPSCAAPARPESRKETTMTKPKELLRDAGRIPPIDAVAPAKTETATFALG